MTPDDGSRFVVRDAAEGCEVVDSRTGDAVAWADERWMAEHWAAELNARARRLDGTDSPDTRD